MPDFTHYKSPTKQIAFVSKFCYSMSSSWTRPLPLWKKAQHRMIKVNKINITLHQKGKKSCNSVWLTLTHFRGQDVSEVFVNKERERGREGEWAWWRKGEGKGEGEGVWWRYFNEKDISMKMCKEKISEIIPGLYAHQVDSILTLLYPVQTDGCSSPCLPTVKVMST